MAINLKNWLRRKPEPSCVRIDGKKTVMIGEGPGRFREAVQTFDALRPTLLEALNDAGAVLRVTRIEPEDEDEDEDEDTGGTAPTMPVAVAAPATVGGTPLAELTQLAALIMEAGDRGALRHAEAYSLAFAKQTEILQIVADRMTATETAWQTTLANQAERQQSIIDSLPETDAAGSAIGSLLQLAANVKPGVVKGATK
jgi:hypothetical protein